VLHVDRSVGTVYSGTGPKELVFMYCSALLELDDEHVKYGQQMCSQKHVERGDMIQISSNLESLSYTH